MSDFSLWELTEIQTQMILWGAIALLAAIVELSTLALVSMWFAIGGVAAFFAAYFGVPFLWQFAIFVLTSLILSVVMIPFVRKRNQNYEPTNSDSLVGREAITESELNVLTRTGRVMVDGQSWSGFSTTGSNIPANTIVVIKKIEGVTLYVEPK